MMSKHLYIKVDLHYMMSIHLYIMVDLHYMLIQPHYIMYMYVSHYIITLVNVNALAKARTYRLRQFQRTG